MGAATPPRRTGRGDSPRRMIARIVREFGRREGHPPSLRKIAEGAGPAVSTVSYHLSVLEQDGVLRRGAGRPRKRGPGRAPDPQVADRAIRTGLRDQPSDPDPSFRTRSPRTDVGFAERSAFSLSRAPGPAARAAR